MRVSFERFVFFVDGLALAGAPRVRDDTTTPSRFLFSCSRSFYFSFFSFWCIRRFGSLYDTGVRAFSSSGKGC